ncbi:MAG: flagellar hook-basal body protein [Pseudoduganella sp.]|jgi:flagellar basal-body rod protein FlgG|nr:flagellar hook-basal body protein [Pseudoduganella sp.]
MSDALHLAISAMQSDTRRLETISHNLANVSTPGYRRALAPAAPFAAALAAAAPLASDLRPGALRQTSSALDAAIAGDGYFELETPDGPAYTRAGSFQVAASGELMHESGWPVAGVGGPLRLYGASATLGSDGSVREGARVVGQLKVVRFDDARGLQRGGGSLLRPGAGVAGSAVPAALRVGYLELSNVDAGREALTMLETVRRFEAAQKLYQGYDEAMRGALQLIGQ